MHGTHIIKIYSGWVSCWYLPRFQLVFPVVGSTHFTLCYVVGFTFTTVICAGVLTAFTLCFVLYSLRVPICVLFPAIVEKAKISHQLTGHLCTYVHHLSHTKIVGSRPCTAWNISSDMSVPVLCEWVQHKRSGVLIEPSMEINGHYRLTRL